MCAVVFGVTESLSPAPLRMGDDAPPRALLLCEEEGFAQLLTGTIFRKRKIHCIYLFGTYRTRGPMSLKPIMFKKKKVDDSTIPSAQASPSRPGTTGQEKTISGKNKNSQSPVVDGRMVVAFVNVMFSFHAFDTLSTLPVLVYVMSLPSVLSLLKMSTEGKQIHAAARGPNQINPVLG